MRGGNEFRAFNRELQSAMRQLDALRQAVSKKGKLDLPTYVKLQDLKEHIKLLSDTAHRTGGGGSERPSSCDPSAGFPRAGMSQESRAPSQQDSFAAVYPPEVAQYCSASQKRAPLHLSSTGGVLHGAQRLVSQMVWRDLARPVPDVPTEQLCGSHVTLESVLGGTGSGGAAGPSSGQYASPMSPSPPPTTKPKHSSRPVSRAQNQSPTFPSSSPGAGTDRTLSGLLSPAPGYTSANALYDGANRVGSPRAWPNADHGGRSRTPLGMMHRGGPRPPPRVALQANNGGQIGPRLPNRGELLVEVVSLTVLEEKVATQPLRLEIRIPGSQSAPRRGPADQFPTDGPEPPSQGSVLLEVFDARKDDLTVTLMDGDDPVSRHRLPRAAGGRYGAYLSLGPEEDSVGFDSEAIADPEKSLGCLRYPLASLVSEPHMGKCLDWTVDGVCTVRFRIMFFPVEREDAPSPESKRVMKGKSRKGKHAAGAPSQAVAALQPLRGPSSLSQNSRPESQQCGDAGSLWSDSPSPVLHPPRPQTSMH